MLLPSSSRIWADLLHSMKRPSFFGEPHGGRDPLVSSIRCNPVSVGPTEPISADKTPVFPMPELWNPQGRAGSRARERAGLGTLLELGDARRLGVSPLDARLGELRLGLREECVQQRIRLRVPTQVAQDASDALNRFR